MDNDYHDLGNSLQESGRFDEAVAAYKKSIELNPRFFLVLSQFGRCFAET